MASVTFENRDKFLTFESRNKSNIEVTAVITGYMIDENGSFMVDESGNKMTYVTDATAKPIVVTFEKRDNELIFGERL